MFRVDPIHLLVGEEVGTHVEQYVGKKICTPLHVQELVGVKDCTPLYALISTPENESVQP